MNMSSGSTMACDCPSLEESCIDYIVSLCVVVVVVVVVVVFLSK